MAAPDPLRPPADKTRSELLRLARRVAMLEARRRRLRAQLDQLEGDLRTAKRLTRELLEDAVPISPDPQDDDLVSPSPEVK